MPEEAAEPEGDAASQGAAGSERAVDLEDHPDPEKRPVHESATVPAASVGEPGSVEPRQSVIRSAGARRARLTPAPNTDTSPEPPSREEGGQTSGDGSSTSANDARLRQDKPPHW